MRSWIYHSRGRVLRQAHVGLEALGGLKEDELSRFGFRVAAWPNSTAATSRRAGPASKATSSPGISTASSSSLPICTIPAAFRFAGSRNHSRVGLVSWRSKAMSYYMRNVDGDEVHFVHEGTGTFDTEFGPIPYEPGDYVLIPKGVTYRILPDGDVNYFFLTESVGEVGFADIGPIGRHAPFDPSILFVPTPHPEEAYGKSQDTSEWELRIKSGNEYTSILYPFDPMDVVGWKGDLFPFKINIRDYRPITSERMHLMPSAHGIFAAKGFVICNFLPRPAEGERDVERVPPFHRNIDYDEVMFTHGGKILDMPVAPASIFRRPRDCTTACPTA